MILLELAAQSNIASMEDRSQSTITLRDHRNGSDVCYNILRNIRFDSARRMMSMVVQETNTGEIFVFSKGADSAILPLIRDGSMALRI